MRRTPPSAPTPVLAVALVATAAVVYAVSALSDAGRALDRAIIASQLQDGPVESISAGLVLVVNPATALAATAAVFGLAWRNHGVRAAVMSVLLIVGALGTARALKAALPEVAEAAETARTLGPGFWPSGHAAITTALAVASVLAWRAEGRPRVVPLVAIGAGVSIAANLSIEYHHASDLLGGMLLAAAWGVLVLPVFGIHRVDASAARPSSALLALAGLVALLGVGVAVLVALAREAGVVPTTVEPLLPAALGACFAAAVTLIASLAAVVTGGRTTARPGAERRQSAGSRARRDRRPARLRPDDRVA